MGMKKKILREELTLILKRICDGCVPAKIRSGPDASPFLPGYYKLKK